MNKVRDVVSKYKAGILRLLLCAVLVIFVYSSDYQCVFLKYLHIQCMGCGMSRAWKEALQGHFVEAYEYHKAFWTIPIIGIYIMRGKFFEKKLWNIMIISVISLCFIINYIDHFI